MMMKTILLLLTMLMASCNSIGPTRQADPLPTLPDVLRLGHNKLSHDSVPAMNYPVITEEQRIKLKLNSSLVLPDSARVIGVREIAGHRTLEAYLEPLSEDENDFKVYLTTRGSDGYGIHTIDLGPFHTSEHQGPMRLGGNRFYTTDAELHFEGKNHIVLHRVMTLTSIYLKNHQLTELWRVEWDNRYEIDEHGHIVFAGQEETSRMPAELDDPIIADYQARDRGN